jgi:hypothetical protein
VSYAGRIRAVCLLALLCAGSAMPQVGWAHSEGIEAADPSTPAAMLGLQSATIRYARPNTQALQWRLLFDSRPDSIMHGAHHAPEAAGSNMGNVGNVQPGMHSGHAGAASTAPATAQQ